MKPKYIIGIILGGIIAVVAVTFALNSQQTYVTLADAVESGNQVQVRGTWVKEKGADYNASENVFRFTLRDEDGKVMPVEYREAKPNNFELAEEIVVGGRVENGMFMAKTLLTKCPSKYEATSIDVNEQSSR